MIIRKLTIRKYRGVTERKYSFPRSLAVLPSDAAETVRRAIGIVLKSEELAGPPGTWELEAESEIVSEIVLQNETLLVRVTADPESGKPVWNVTNGQRLVSPTEYFYKIHVPPEEEKANCYLVNRSYREVLESYREPERFLSAKEFTRSTEGIGDTIVFRQVAMAKVRECTEKRSEKMDNLQLFVQLKDFWQTVQRIRDLHHEGWPVFFFAPHPELSIERLKESLTKNYKRQVFFALQAGGGVSGESEK